MKATFKVGLSALAAAVMFTAPGHALLVNYEFEGVITQSEFDEIEEGSTYTGSLTFDPGEASVAGLGPGSFDLPLNLNVHVGPYRLTADHSGGPGARFSPDGVAFPSMFAEGADKYFNLKMDVVFSGDDIFEETPTSSLEGGRWANAHGRGEDSRFGIFDDSPPGDGPSARGEFTRFEFVDGGDPVAPVPEPATMIIFGTGLAGAFGAGLRKKKEKKS